MIVSIKYATIRFLSKIGTNGENLEIKWRNTKFHLHVYVYILLITLCINCTTMTFFYNNICGYWQGRIFWGGAGGAHPPRFFCTPPRNFCTPPRKMCTPLEKCAPPKQKVNGKKIRS